MSREFLVTKFKCAKCGSLLKIDYNKASNGIDYADGEPTGCEMVQQFVSIEPCRKCMQPVKDVQQAIRTLISHGSLT